jgi:hypothetical protein
MVRATWREANRLGLRSSPWFLDGTPPTSNFRLMQLRTPAGVIPLMGLLSGCPDTPVSFGASSDEVGDSTGADTDGASPDAPSTETGSEDVAVDDHRTYFIGESRKFDGGGTCNNADLNTITSTLTKELVDAGWEGLRFVDGHSWPEDFREGSMFMSAFDDLYGDAARFSVYAGHGNALKLQWGRPSANGACTTTIRSMVRLGRLAGDTAAATMLLTSCALRTDQVWATFKENAVRQIYGYHDSPHIGYDEARKVFKRSQDGQPMAHAWLDEMVHNAHGMNSPVVMTFGNVPGEAEFMHTETHLASGEGFIVDVMEPIRDFYFEWLDNGCTVRCGACTDNAAMLPEIVIGTTAPQLRLTRPVRSSVAIVDRIKLLLPFFELAPLSAEDTERLTTWASTVVEARDIAFARFGGFELSYDPSSDLLRVHDREALGRARPRWTESTQDLDAASIDVLRRKAAELRAAMETLPGLLDPLGMDFEVSMRKVGFGGENRPTRELAYEYLFDVRGRFAEFEVVGSHLQIGMTRFGELGSITVAGMDVEIVGGTPTERSVEAALEAIRVEFEAKHPAAKAIEFVEPRVGYALREDQAQAEVDASLVVGVVLAFPGDGTLDMLDMPDMPDMVSRRSIVKMSLVSLDAPLESLEAIDHDAEEGGDSRAAN